jgi:hypothetical protein
MDRGPASRPTGSCKPPRPQRVFPIRCIGAAAPPSPRLCLAFVLVIVVASWALVGGFAEVFAGFGAGESAGTRAMFILAGLVSVARSVTSAAT